MEPIPFNPLDELRLVASKNALGFIHSWEIPPVADRALSNGIYSDSLLALTQIDQPTMFEVEPLLEKALAELRLHSPSRTEAAWHLARHCIHLLASGDEPPVDTLSFLMTISERARDVLPHQSHPIEGLDLGSLIQIYYEYSEVNWDYDARNKQAVSAEDKRLLQVDELARREGREWLARHPDAASPGESPARP